MTKPKPKAPWRYVVGMSPHQVTAFEDARSGHVVLRWYNGKGKRALRGLKFSVRGARGQVDRDAERRAIEHADQWHRDIAAGLWPPTTNGVTRDDTKSLTIVQGWDLAKDPEKGKWNKDTPHRADIERAIKRAARVWRLEDGTPLTWNDIDRGELRQLWRSEYARLQAGGHRGYRGAELTLDLVLAVAAWLRDERHIIPTACLRWDNMMAEFEKDAGEHEPYQPRYTVEEYRKLFKAAWEADERYGLLYDLGAEYRLGQVSPCRRSDLDREKGRLRIQGHGKKQGEIVVLMEAQRANVDYVLTTGYLAGLEAAYEAKQITDYPLFPGGHFARDRETKRLVSRAEYAERAPLIRDSWMPWHRRAEELAGIPYIKGRGPYGSRRGGVDAADELAISRKGMRAWGGWANNQMPDNIYANKENEKARHEAAEVRALARGGTTGPGIATRELPETSQNVAKQADGAESSAGNDSAPSGSDA